MVAVAFSRVVKSGAMGISGWATGNWFDLLQSLGIIGGLLFTAWSLRSETRTRRVNNLLAITKGHRDIWTEFYRQPKLKRVLADRADLGREGITREEEIFIPGRSEPIVLSRRSFALRLLQYVRDEAHRIAQHYHHLLRKKRTLE